MTSPEYGIVANSLESDPIFRDGAKVWIVGGTGGEGRTRFIWFGLNRTGYNVRKWAPTARFGNFRAAWIPLHLRDRVGYIVGSRSDMEATAAQLNEFAQNERDKHQRRRNISRASSTD